jgi:hypothetical protein
MTTEIKDSVGSIETSTIDKLEKNLGIRLPSQYREFLKKYNGGYPIPDGFFLKDKSDGSSIDRFLGIDVGEHSNLEKYLVIYKGRIPKNLFPIAHDPGGNLIVIGLSGDTSDKIYFWDHEQESDDYEPEMSNIHLIADSFEEFLGGLYEIDIE